MDASGPEYHYSQMVNDPNVQLTDFERRCALLWPECVDDERLAQVIYAAEYEDLEELSPRKRREFDFQARRRVRHAVAHAAEVISKTYVGFLEQAGEEVNRELFAAARGPRDTRASSPLIGLVTYLNCADMTESEYRATLRDPHNQEDRQLRSPLLTSRVLKEFSPVECLRLLGRQGRMAAEYAAL